MAEYIEREAVINAVTSRKVNEMLRSDITEQMIDGRNPSAWLNGFDCGMQQAIDIIAATTPTADVAEVRHGSWIYEPPTATLHASWRCSACELHFWQHILETNRFAYCPYCGAKMDGKGEGE